MKSSTARAVQGVQADRAASPLPVARLELCFEKWNTLWTNSQLYIERLKGTELVLSGLEEATKFVSKVEIKLASYDNMPSDADALKKIHDELVDLQSTIQLQQGVIDQLTDEVGTLRQMVEKSRTAVNATMRKHSDVDRLEAEVHTVVTRYTNICTQVNERQVVESRALVSFRLTD